MSHVVFCRPVWNPQILLRDLLAVVCYHERLNVLQLTVDFCIELGSGGGASQAQLTSSWHEPW